MQYKKTITDEIVDTLREKILKGEYKIGEQIKEENISNELNVSRTPIREAFKILEEEGLIDYIPNRGCFAKGFNNQDIEDIYKVRTALETIVVEMAIDRITDEEIQDIKEQCDLMEHYTRKGDVEKVLDLNTSFHNVIYTAARSRFLHQVLLKYKEYLDKTRKLIQYNQDYLDGILLEHIKIYEAFKRRDKEGALKAMKKHMDSSSKRMFAAWGK